MTSTPLLSVLLTTHTKPRYLEQLLASLLSFESPSLEVILINDASDKMLSEALRQVFSRTEHTNAFLFEHDHFLGRGASLNEALINARGSLVWAPLRADKLNESLLSEAVTRFAKDPAAFWMLDDTLPRDINAWADAAEEGTLPDDSRFVWNRAIIPTNQFFFQPAMDEFHGCELAARIAPGKSWQSTDAFFIVPREAGPPADMKVLQEILLTMVRRASDLNDRMQLLEALGTLHSAPDDPAEKSSSKLDQAWQLKDDDPRKALDVINTYLKRKPDDQEAVKLKILLLEKLRRHVEASELKHDLQRKNTIHSEQAALFPTDGKPDPAENRNEIPAAQVRLSVIIPTTGDCKPILEECLVHLHGCVDASETELIVIDNASIDDTFDYLEQLQQKNFLNIRVITNQQNRGFGPSINQGLRQARGPSVLIMHNDVFPEEDTVRNLLSIIESNPDIGLAGPLMDRCDNPDQLLTAHAGSTEKQLRVKNIDSACMLLRKAANIQFDESLTPAFFDDLDLCNQLAENGYYCCVATNAKAVHRHRVTTEAMGLHLEPELEWQNADQYMSKWNSRQDVAKPDSEDAIEALKELEMPVNPMNPPANWLAIVEQLLSDETKTSIHNGTWESEFLFKMTSILMIADQREFLRRIETRIESEELPEPLLKSFIRYYYKKNIYSRCHHYLERASGNDPFYDLYRLRISVAEKDEGLAVDLLSQLIKLFPCHPELYKLTGDIHRINGNEGEAKSFHALANQLNPVLFHPENEPFEIKY